MGQKWNRGDHPLVAPEEVETPEIPTLELPDPSDLGVYDMDLSPLIGKIADKLAEATENDHRTIQIVIHHEDTGEVVTTLDLRRESADDHWTVL